MLELQSSQASFADRSLQFEQPFVELLRHAYDAEPQRLDFQHASRAAVDTINDWAADVTRGRIENLLPTDALDANTRVVLAHAMYFKGTWSTPFDPKYTSRRPFVGSDGRKRSAPFMWRVSEFGVARVENSVAVELPYHGDRFAMLVILPPEGVAMATFEEQLDGRMFERIVDGLVPQRSGISVPRFTVRDVQTGTIMLVGHVVQP